MALTTHPTEALKGCTDLKQVEDIFAEGTDLQAKMKEIKLWLRDNNVENLERVALAADQLESVSPTETPGQWSGC